MVNSESIFIFHYFNLMSFHNTIVIFDKGKKIQININRVKKKMHYNSSANGDSRRMFMISMIFWSYNKLLMFVNDLVSMFLCIYNICNNWH